MNDVIISVENLSKRYRLGQIGATTMRESVENWLARMRGKRGDYLTPVPPGTRAPETAEESKKEGGADSRQWRESGRTADREGDVSRPAVPSLEHPSTLSNSKIGRPQSCDGARQDSRDSVTHPAFAKGEKKDSFSTSSQGNGDLISCGKQEDESPSSLRTRELERGRAGVKKSSGVASSDDAELWALRDVSFEVKRGEVLGIIGRNGAGKSTLLKILSRITEPTSGRAIMRGRVASLLEVGTGFHPELTGRENIYLNGAILGMRHREITAKFDEIVAFSEVERFIDTPVKRYSSGMYVRLAFAVAAHLDPEILLVDEVLAVGDLEFRKKCLGKMQNVSEAGKTVLFVSHQMNAIRRLCSRCIWLENGSIKLTGKTSQIVNSYEQSRKQKEGQKNATSHVTKLRFVEWFVAEGESIGHSVRKTNESVLINFVVDVSKEIRNGTFGVALLDKDEKVVWANAFYGISLGVGHHSLRLSLESLPLRPGEYSWNVSLYDESTLLDFWSAFPVLVIDSKINTHPRDEWAGILNIESECLVQGDK